MTNKQAFLLAHMNARIDHKFEPSHSYAYHFRLHLLNCQAEQRRLKTGMVPAFQIHEPASWLGFSRK